MKSEKYLALEELAKQQYGYFTGKQAMECGYARSCHGSYCRQGTWIGEDWGIYRLPGIPCEGLEARCAFLSLWSRNRDDRPQAAVSHQSAQFFHGLLGQPTGPVHLTVPLSFRKAAPGEVLLHYEDLPDDTWEQRKGFRVTVLDKTLADMKKASPVGTAAPALNNEASAGMGIVTAGSVMPGSTGKREDNMTAPSGNNLSVWGHSSRAKYSGRGLGAALRNPKGFTLVELLMVVAIIGILASLLLPTLVKARESATGLKCLNNLRNIAQIANFYSGDYAGRIPRPQTSSSWFWTMDLQKYHNGGLAFMQMNPPETAKAKLFTSVFVCAKYGPEKMGIGGWVWQLTGYGMNLGLPPCTSANTFAERAASFPNLQRLKAPSKTILFGDSVGLYKPDLGEWHIGAAASAFDTSSIFGYVHQNLASTVYADGHSKAGVLPFYAAQGQESSYMKNGTY